MISTKYVVKKQDCLVSIAAKHGMLPEKIWDHPDNTSLRNKRKNGKILYPGDVLAIPPLETKSESIKTNTLTRFRRKGLCEKLTLYLKDEYGNARSNLRYVITLDGHHLEGTTDDKGKIEFPVPNSAKMAKLVFGEDGEEIQHLLLGELNPVDTLSGAQQRLTNLAYVCDQQEGQMDISTEDAIRTFQSDYDLPVTGSYDETTAAKLEEVYGC